MRERISHLLKSLFVPAGSGARQSGKNRPVLGVEPLENRLTPTVTAFGPASDFHVDIDANETVSLGRTDNFKLRVTADGNDLPVQAAASSVEKLTITANHNVANSLDLSGIHLADFVSLNQILVKLDAQDTFNRGAGWTAAGKETIDGQRYAVFTQGNATLKVTDFAQDTPPPTAARGILASLVRIKVKRKAKLDVRVSYADTGAIKSQFRSPFQQPAFRKISVSVKDGNGDGVADTVVLTARKGRKTFTRQFAV